VKINDRRLNAEDSKNIIDLQVTTAPNTLDYFRLSIANAFPRMRWTHSSDADLFKEGNAITIKMGYVDNLHQVFSGEITRICPVFPETGTPTVTVQGYSRLHRLNGSPKIRNFKDKTDKEIVETVARDREVHLTPKADATRIRHAYVMQENQTNLAFLTQRAQRIGFEVMVDDKTLIFCKKKTEQSKTYTLIWGKPHKSFAPDSKTLALTSFYPDFNALNQIKKVTVRGYDPKTKKNIEGVAKSHRRRTPAKTDVHGKYKEEVIVEKPVSSREAADLLARSVYDERLLEVLTGKGSCIGLPVLRAGRIIELGGIGKRFSGLYYVTQSTHTISGSGYSTTFSAKRKDL
jgi:phage protein D